MEEYDTLESFNTENNKYIAVDGTEYASYEEYKRLIAEWANARTKCQRLCEIVSKCQSAEVITGSLMSVYNGINESVDFTHDQLRAAAEEISPLIETHAQDLASNIVDCARNIKISKRGSNEAISALNGINDAIGILGQKAIDFHNRTWYPKYVTACRNVNKPIEKFM